MVSSRQSVVGGLHDAGASGGRDGRTALVRRSRHVLYSYSSIQRDVLGLVRFNSGYYGPIVVEGVLLAALVHDTYDAVVTYASLSGPTFVAFIVVYDGVVLYYLYRKLARYRRAYHSGSTRRGATEP